MIPFNQGGQYLQSSPLKREESYSESSVSFGESSMNNGCLVTLRIPWLQVCADSQSSTHSALSVRLLAKDVGNEPDQTSERPRYLLWKRLHRRPLSKMSGVGWDAVWLLCFGHAYNVLKSSTSFTPIYMWVCDLKPRMSQ
jgi:hypothetical protein